MQMIIHRASWQRITPLLIFAAMLAFAAWNLWDGYHRLPQIEDAVVAANLRNPKLSSGERSVLNAWPGYARAITSQRLRLDRIFHNNEIKNWIPSSQVQGVQLAAETVAMLAAFPFLLAVWVSTIKLKATDAGLFIWRTGQLDWQQILEIDNRRWATDGLVVLAFSPKFLI